MKFFQCGLLLHWFVPLILLQIHRFRHKKLSKRFVSLRTILCHLTDSTHSKLCEITKMRLIIHFDRFLSGLCYSTSHLWKKLETRLFRCLICLFIVIDVVGRWPATLSRVLVFDFLRRRTSTTLRHFVIRNVAVDGGIKIMWMQRGFVVEKFGCIRSGNASLTCSSNQRHLKAVESWRIFCHLSDWRVSRWSRVRWSTTREVLRKWIVLLLFNLLAVQVSLLHLLVVETALFGWQLALRLCFQRFSEFQWNAHIADLQSLTFQSKSAHRSVGVAGSPSLAVHEKRVLEFRFNVNLRPKIISDCYWMSISECYLWPVAIVAECDHYEVVAAQRMNLHDSRVGEL